MPKTGPFFSLTLGCQRKVGSRMQMSWNFRNLYYSHLLESFALTARDRRALKAVLLQCHSRQSRDN